MRTRFKMLAVCGFESSTRFESYTGFNILAVVDLNVVSKSEFVIDESLYEEYCMT